MDLINPLVQEYADNYLSATDDLRERVFADTERTHTHAHMMSSRQQGKFLEIFSIVMGPSRILEIGTFTGYSALCLACGLQPDGRLYTIELRQDDARTAAQNFNQSNYRDKIILHTGNALEVIPHLNETWDLVFIDADKTGYLAYYQMVLPRVRSGGVILADNVLFHGQVLDEHITGKNAVAIHEFNEFVKNDAAVDQVMLTIRDGLMLIVKK